jgi:hypothetical protein
MNMALFMASDTGVIRKSLSMETFFRLFTIEWDKFPPMETYSPVV